jgi:hypothetical protein
MLNNSVYIIFGARFGAVEVAGSPLLNMKFAACLGSMVEAN